jgi:hypothetical protein
MHFPVELIILRTGHPYGFLSKVQLHFYAQHCIYFVVEDEIIYLWDAQMLDRQGVGITRGAHW